MYESGARFLCVKYRLIVSLIHSLPNLIKGRIKTIARCPRPFGLVAKMDLRLGQVQVQLREKDRGGKQHNLEKTALIKENAELEKQH
jgi:hypothetical protein